LYPLRLPPARSLSPKLPLPCGISVLDTMVMRLCRSLHLVFHLS
jgi:hypothetical protein